jgi:hypothetical protein
VIPFAKAGIIKLGLKYLKIGTKPALMLKTLRFFLMFTLTTGMNLGRIAGRNDRRKKICLG